MGRGELVNRAVLELLKRYYYMSDYKLKKRAEQKV